MSYFQRGSDNGYFSSSSSSSKSRPQGVRFTLHRANMCIIEGNCFSLVKLMSINKKKQHVLLPAPVSTYHVTCGCSTISGHDHYHALTGRAWMLFVPFRTGIMWSEQTLKWSDGCKWNGPCILAITASGTESEREREEERDRVIEEETMKWSRSHLISSHHFASTSTLSLERPGTNLFAVENCFMAIAFISVRKKRQKK